MCDFFSHNHSKCCEGRRRDFHLGDRVLDFCWVIPRDQGWCLGFRPCLGFSIWCAFWGWSFGWAPHLHVHVFHDFQKTFFQICSHILPPSFLFHSLRNWMCILVLFIPVPRFRTNFFWDCPWRIGLVYFHPSHPFAPSTAAWRPANAGNTLTHPTKNGAETLEPKWQFEQNIVKKKKKISFTSHWTWLVPNNGVCVCVVCPSACYASGEPMVFGAAA